MGSARASAAKVKFALVRFAPERSTRMTSAWLRSASVRSAPDRPASAQDASTARTGTGPHVMAAIRNLVISILRLADHATSPVPSGTPPAIPSARSG